MKKRIMAAFTVAVLVVSMAVSVFAGSKDANKDANRNRRPADADVYNYWAEKSSPNDKPWVYWSNGQSNGQSDMDFLNAFVLWNMLYNGGKSTIVAAQKGNAAVPQWKFTSVFFTPGSNVAVYQNFASGAVVQTNTTADGNNTATVDKAKDANGQYAVGAAAALLVGNQ